MVDVKNPAEQLEWLKNVIESRLREEVETAEGRQQDVAFAELKDAIKKASQCSVFVTIGIISDALRCLKGEIESQLFSEIAADQSHVMGGVLDQPQKQLLQQQQQQQHQQLTFLRMQEQQKQQQQQEMQQVQQRLMALQLQQQKQFEQQQQQEMGKGTSDPLPTQSQVPRDMPSVPANKSVSRTDDYAYLLIQLNCLF